MQSGLQIKKKKKSVLLVLRFILKLKICSGMFDSNDWKNKYLQIVCFFNTVCLELKKNYPLRNLEILMSNSGVLESLNEMASMA